MSKVENFLAQAKGTVSQIKQRYFHDRDLSILDGEATQRRLQLYRLIGLSGICIAIARVGFAATPWGAPESASAAIREVALFMIGLGTLYGADSAHLDKIIDTNKQEK